MLNPNANVFCGAVRLRLLMQPSGHSYAALVNQATGMRGLTGSGCFLT